MKSLLPNGSPQIDYEVNYLRLPSDIQAEEELQLASWIVLAKDNLALSFEVVSFLFTVSAFLGQNKSKRKGHQL